jgi:hypothetical protein
VGMPAGGDGAALGGMLNYFLPVVSLCADLENLKGNR